VLLAGSGNTAHVFDDFAPRYLVPTTFTASPGADSALPLTLSPVTSTSVWPMTSFRSPRAHDAE